jgi:hypothetical protein
MNAARAFAPGHTPLTSKNDSYCLVQTVPSGRCILVQASRSPHQNDRVSPSKPSGAHVNLFEIFDHQFRPEISAAAMFMKPGKSGPGQRPLLLALLLGGPVEKAVAAIDHPDVIEFGGAERR